MVSQKKSSPDLPRTIRDDIAAIESEIRELFALRTGYLGNIAAQIHQIFTVNNGCEQCHGRGWIVTWDTLDSMSGAYAEYGRCTNPECNDVSRQKSGLDSSWTKYDRNRGVNDPCGPWNPAYKTLVVPLDVMIRDLTASMERLINNSRPRVGDSVVVVAGRKAPVGTKARIAYIHPNGGILIKDEASWKDRHSNGTWVRAQNISRLT